MQAGKDPQGSQQLTLHCISEVTGCINGMLEALKPLGFSERDLFGIRLAVEEALVNAIRHGHRNDTSKTVSVRYETSAQQFLIEVQDEGPGFDPDSVADPLAPENLERPGGRGVFLMRHYMTWVSFNERGNCVTMCRHRAT
jgi:serine/threonine-protein kinase RsbW